MNILENQQLAEPVDGIYIDLEAQILQNIARHLQGWEQPIDTDRWLMQKLAEIGKLNQENIRLIAKMSGLSQTATERMLNEAAQDAINNMEPGLRYMARRGLAEEAVQADKSKNVKRVVHSFRKQAKDTLNMCNTNMLYKASEKYKGLVCNIAQEAWNILNSGAAGVVSGVEARQQAVRRCIRQLNDKGIPAFVDKRGREWTPEAYVNMAMRNTARSTAEEVQDARIRDAGCHLIQIDSHSGARPKCAKDQGKIFDLNNGSGYTEDLHGKKIKYYPWNSSSYGEPDGILGINCGHHKWPFIPGVNIQRHFPTEDMDANDKLYKQTQVQRALEREVRKQKRECMMLDAAGDQEGFEEASVKLKAKEAKLNHYVDQHDNLHRRKDREQVVGFDKRISAEAVAANKKAINKTEKGFSKEIRKTEKKDSESHITPVFENPSAEIDYRSDQKVTFKNLSEWRKSFGKVTDEEYEIISGMNDTGYIRNSNSYKINQAMRNGAVSELSEGNKKTINTLKSVIERNVSDRDAVLMRKLDIDYIQNVFDVDTGNLKKTVEELNTKKIGKKFTEKGFVSTSYKADKNLNNNDNVLLDIYVPKGTKMFLTKNREESEIILQAGTQFELEGAVLTDDDRIKLIVKAISNT